MLSPNTASCTKTSMMMLPAAVDPIGPKLVSMACWCHKTETTDGPTQCTLLDACMLSGMMDACMLSGMMDACMLSGMMDACMLSGMMDACMLSGMMDACMLSGCTVLKSGNMCLFHR